MAICVKRWLPVQEIAPGRPCLSQDIAILSPTIQFPRIIDRCVSSAHFHPISHEYIEEYIFSIRNMKLYPWRLNRAPYWAHCFPDVSKKGRLLSLICVQHISHRVCMRRWQCKHMLLVLLCTLYNSVSGRGWVVYECAVCIGATVYQTRTLLSSTSSVSVGSCACAHTRHRDGGTSAQESRGDCDLRNNPVETSTYWFAESEIAIAKIYVNTIWEEWWLPLWWKEVCHSERRNYGVRGERQAERREERSRRREI